MFGKAGLPASSGFLSHHLQQLRPALKLLGFYKKKIARVAEQSGWPSQKIELPDLDFGKFSDISESELPHVQSGLSKPCTARDAVTTEQNSTAGKAPWSRESWMYLQTPLPGSVHSEIVHRKCHFTKITIRKGKCKASP